MEGGKREVMSILEIIKRRKTNVTVSFENIVERWLDDKKMTIKKSSYSNYEYMINKYLRPYLQEKKMIELEKYDFNELIKELTLELSPKTVRDIICVLKSILHYMENEYNIKIKTRKIVAPKLNKEDISIFNKQERNRIEQYCIKSNNLKELGILICMNTGLRIGEICALKWKNIDLEKRIIFVNLTLERIYDENLKKTKVIIDKPKTKNSIRQIPISNKLYNVLKPLKKKYKDEDFFLTGREEKYIEPRSYQYIYKRILKTCKVQPHKFHCLRHSFASECIKVGMDIKALSEVLGHANVNITLNVYVHSSYDIKKKFLEKI